MKIDEIMVEGRNGDVPIYYFAYGMLTDPELMQNIDLVGVGELKNFEFEMYAYANVHATPGATVLGCLWSIDRQVLSQLDRTEGYPSLYDRRTVPVVCNGQRYAAEVYVMTPETREWMQAEEPSKGYIDRIVRGYHNAGIPLEQLEQALRTTHENH